VEWEQGELWESQFGCLVRWRRRRRLPFLTSVQ
jgi:hypothetical protein